MSAFPPSVPPNPSQRQPSTPYESFTYNASLATLVICPILVLLPPRKLDLYTFSLVTGFIVAANHQTEVRTGKSILLNLYSKKQERDEQKQRQKTWRQWEEDESGTRRLAKQIWKGDERPDWKEKRMQEERDYEAQGKGIGDAIVDQIKDVWGVAKANEDDENGNEKKS